MPLVSPCVEDNERRIYLSRADALYRKVENEVELQKFLADYGFEIVVSVDLKFVEQIRFFKEEKVVVAPHGAGLSNLVFCSPSTKVIELFSAEYINGCYWTLAQQVGLDYYYIVGQPDPTRRGDRQISYFDRLRSNIKVDIVAFKTILERQRVLK